MCNEVIKSKGSVAFVSDLKRRSTASGFQSLTHFECGLDSLLNALSERLHSSWDWRSFNGIAEKLLIVNWCGELWRWTPSWRAASARRRKKLGGSTMRSSDSSAVTRGMLGASSSCSCWVRGAFVWLTLPNLHAFVTPWVLFYTRHSFKYVVTDSVNLTTARLFLVQSKDPPSVFRVL